MWVFIFDGELDKCRDHTTTTSASILAVYVSFRSLGIPAATLFLRTPLQRLILTPKTTALARKSRTTKTTTTTMRHHCDCNGRGGDAGERIRMPWHHCALASCRWARMISVDGPSPTSLSASQPPSLTPSPFPPAFAVGWDSRTHMSSIPVRSTRRLVLQAPRQDLPYSSSGAAAAADGCGRRKSLLSMAGGRQQRRG